MHQRHSRSFEAKDGENTWPLSGGVIPRRQEEGRSGAAAKDEAKEIDDVRELPNCRTRVGTGASPGMTCEQASGSKDLGIEW